MLHGNFESGCVIVSVMRLCRLGRLQVYSSLSLDAVRKLGVQCWLTHGRKGVAEEGGGGEKEGHDELRTFESSNLRIILMHDAG
jgi:hypothetical protein